MKKKQAQPSFSGLLRIRKEIVVIQQSLAQAYARTDDPLERSRIDRVREELGEVLSRLEKQVLAIRTLNRMERTYEKKITTINTRIDRLIAPQFRTGERWIRRWKSM